MCSDDAAIQDDTDAKVSFNIDLSYFCYLLAKYYY